MEERERSKGIPSEDASSMYRHTITVDIVV
jgi:hypothetical protein